MLKKIIAKKSYIWLLSLDTLLLSTACLIPAISHSMAVPLYMFNPMLALLLVGMLTEKDWRNTIVLALLLPLSSWLLTGIPSLSKMICMVGELVTVVVLFRILSSRWAVLPAIMGSVLVSKCVYYVLKFIFIAPDVLVGTDWRFQIVTILFWGCLYAILYKERDTIV